MRWLLWCTTCVLTLVIGCATTSHDLLPPDAETLPPAFQIQSASDRQSLDYFLLKMADASPEKRVHWWVEFRRANLWRDVDRALACDKFAALSKQERFPLRHLALVRAHQTCAFVSKPPTLMDLATVERLSWLEKPVLEARWSIAQAKQDHALEFDLLLEKSKLSLLPEEKLELTLAALKVAEDLKDPARIEKALERREKVSARFTREPKPSDWLPMAQDLRRAREFEQARRYYEKVIKRKKTPRSVRLSALRGLAQTLKTERKKREYLEVLEQISKQTEPGKKSRNTTALRQHHDAVVFLARALWTEDAVSRARHLLLQKAKSFNKRLGRSEIFWLLGRMSEEARDYPEAVKWFKKAEAELEPKSELHEKVMWYLAWNLRKLKRWPEAVQAMAHGRDNSLNEFSKARFQYWLARTMKDANPNDNENIKKAYEELIQADPLGYYGLLAYHDLDRPIRRETAVRAPPANPSRLKEVLDHPLFEWLLAVEENDLGRELLDQASDRVRRSAKGQNDEATWTDLFNAYARTGYYQQLYESLGKVPADQRQAILAQHPDLLFPQPYRESVMAAADQHSVPAELLFAIMRQESSFNPRARSPADAFGLMQLLPEVAADAAPIAKVAYERAEDLFNPFINIPLGAFHIRQLWDRFDGQFILAVASYNASERAILTWLRMRYHGDTTTFIEDIPYEETRGYIRLVMRNMIFYKLLNSSSGEIDFPDWVLKLKPPKTLEQ
ncbi:MAG: tetratricopeptide repeat protein [Bdellovibrionales bacterium]